MFPRTAFDAYIHVQWKACFQRQRRYEMVKDFCVTDQSWRLPPLSANCMKCHCGEILQLQAAVSGTHRFQVSCAHLPMPAQLGATVSFQSVAVSNRRRLRSSSSSQLVIRRTQLSTVGDRAFPVAGCHLWNSLPPDVTSASTLTVFRNRLETHLFSRSFPS